MKFKDYQNKAKETDQNYTPSETDKNKIIPILGLVGEVGALLSEYKKQLRDDGYRGFENNLKEELGDILWYVSNIATKFNLNLDEIAENNLKKIKNRWMKLKDKYKLYDEKFSKEEQLPRSFSYKFCSQDKKIIIENLSSGEQIGDLLKDNTYEEDHYRYHDIMHMTFMVYFGWSPVFRKLLKKQRQKIKDAEDSGRPQIIEEAIIHIAFISAIQHDFFKNTNSRVDNTTLKLIKNMTYKLEVKNRSESEWEQALLKGFELWQKLIDHKGGIIHGDLNKKTISFKKIKS